MKRMNMKYIIGNFKMNPATLAEAREIVKGIKRFALKAKGVTTALALPYPYLFPLASFFSSKNFALSAQDVFFEYSGAHTGEVSPIMLKNVKVTYCIVGHSERRAQGESNDMVNKKVRALLKTNIRPVLCIGEGARDKNASYLTVLEEQITEGLKGVSPGEIKKIIIAYEPVWAIGKSTDEAMSPAQLQETVLFIRKILSDLFGKSPAFSIPILYGGSVDGDNAKKIIEEGAVDGLLVGRASLEVKVFGAILSSAYALTHGRPRG